jgi:putative nucleotidyltransferase with HDIG domain
MVGQRRLRFHGRSHPRGASFFVVAAMLAVVIATAIAAPEDDVTALTVILGIAAIGAGVMVAGARDGLSVSASFIVNVLAAAFLGARSAMATAVISELTAAIQLHTRPRAVILANLPASVVPAAAAAVVIELVAGRASHAFQFYLSVAVAAMVAITLSFVIFTITRRTFFAGWDQFGVGEFVDHLPSISLNVLLVLAGAAITIKLGNAGIAFALTAVFTFSYMAHLLQRARHRSKQYVSLSWGVLAGLMRSLDIRDGRAARHAAAVARFSQDMAKKVGMGDQEQELAHTAGLLHDIGHFALSDRVAERGRTLTEADWAAIQRHPELGADMLKDLGMYGPVAEIILAHHERVDGRGYPMGLTEEKIPEIAKIIAVAEVYDTLTASDTYRTRMSSFEAMHELRRVAGSQLDEGYVEVLASLLSGEGVDYRHADAADFDSELDMERRIREAGTG